MNSHGGSLQRLISELIDKDTTPSAIVDKASKEVKESHDKLKLINEKAQLFRITSNAMISVCAVLRISLRYSLHMRLKACGIRVTNICFCFICRCSY